MTEIRRTARSPRKRADSVRGARLALPGHGRPSAEERRARKGLVAERWTTSVAPGPRAGMVGDLVSLQDYAGLTADGHSVLDAPPAGARGTLPVGRDAMLRRHARAVLAAAPVGKEGVPAGIVRSAARFLSAAAIVVGGIAVSLAVAVRR